MLCHMLYVSSHLHIIPKISIELSQSVQTKQFKIIFTHLHYYHQRICLLPFLGTLRHRLGSKCIILQIFSRQNWIFPTILADVYFCRSLGTTLRLTDSVSNVITFHRSCSMWHSYTLQYTGRTKANAMQYSSFTDKGSAIISSSPTSKGHTWH